MFGASYHALTYWYFSMYLQFSIGFNHQFEFTNNRHKVKDYFETSFIALMNFHDKQLFLLLRIHDND